MKSYTDLDQSKKLAEFLPLKSADMCYKCIVDCPYDIICKPYSSWKEEYIGLLVRGDANVIPCWSLGALLNVLPEINGIPLKVEKVKAKDGYDGYYYHIEYEGIVLIPYSKNPVDAYFI